MAENTIVNEEAGEDNITEASVIEEDQCSPEPFAELPSLSLKEAALLLGKSIRALERSLLGKWGNKLPEGWTASRKVIDGKEEWLIHPPEEFKYEHVLESLKKPAESSMHRLQAEDLLRPIRAHFESESLNEVHGLLRELANTHRELAEQRKLHNEDLKTLLQLQSSMRLLEVNASETGKLRAELVEAQNDLINIGTQYREFLALPWWKRLFKKLP